jgi:hypothetical protein
MYFNGDGCAGLPSPHKKARSAFMPVESLPFSKPQVSTGANEAAAQMIRLQEEYQQSEKAQAMMAFRRKLPSFHMRDAVLQALSSNQACYASKRNLLTMSEHSLTCREAIDMASCHI